MVYILDKNELLFALSSISFLLNSISGDQDVSDKLLKQAMDNFHLGELVDYNTKLLKETMRVALEV